MIHSAVLGILAITALLLGNIDVARTQEIDVPMVAVFHEDASLESFRSMYQADERERLNPESWRYLDLVHSCRDLCLLLCGDVLDRHGDRRLIVEV
jgi:hypothetical protein